MQGEALLVSEQASARQPLALLRDVRITRDGRALLDGLSLTIPSGGVTALVGPNGAGKSLVLQLFAGLTAPDSGEVALFPSARGATALVFQKPVLLRRTVRANLDFALKVAGAPRAARPARAATLLELARLSGVAAQPARALSGGEQQRLALVRALASEPHFLLLDEPTASLDPDSTRLVEALVQEAASKNVTVLLVTHDIGQVRRLADHVLFLDRGALTEASAASVFLDDPHSPEARAYLDGRLTP